MTLFLEFLDVLITDVVEISSVVLEMFGIIVLMYTAIASFIKWIRHQSANIRLELAHGIALALEFKMGGEVLRTVIVHEISELVILGAIIILRAMLTFLIHWEIQTEKKDIEDEAAAEKVLKESQDS